MSLLGVGGRFRLFITSSALSACLPETIDPPSEDDDSPPAAESSASVAEDDVSETPPGDEGDNLDSDDEAGIFVPTSDVWWERCDFWAQDCPEGQKCTPFSAGGDLFYDAHRCVNVVAAPKLPDERCLPTDTALGGEDNCDDRSMCVYIGVLGSNEGVCAAFCEGHESDYTCPHPDDFCNLTGDGVFNICRRGCDPLANACPAQRPLCFANGSSRVYECHPRQYDHEPVSGGPCSGSGQCPAGEVCIDNEKGRAGCDDERCCAPYCDLNDPEACREITGQICAPVFESFPPEGYEDVGACTAKN